MSDTHHKTLAAAWLALAKAEGINPAEVFGLSRQGLYNYRSGERDASPATREAWATAWNEAGHPGFAITYHPGEGWTAEKVHDSS